MSGKAAMIYHFGKGKADVCEDELRFLGSKGANLAEMSRIGLPVPPGFTIATPACNHYLANHRQFPDGLEAAVMAAIDKLEKSVKRRFGSGDAPLLVSVRSGAQISMPGMMDTILNLGLNDETAEAFARKTGDDRFAYDTYRRFIQMYGSVVIGVPFDEFEDLLSAARKREKVSRDDELSAQGLRLLCDQYKQAILDDMDEPFPQDAHAQLWGAIGAVFSSWKNPRAVTYRALHAIPNDWATAVTVQMMVFGNSGPQSATGVAFTRDPSTGEQRFFGEYLSNAQGEDVVSGIRTPDPLSPSPGERKGNSLREKLPHSYSQLQEMSLMLERHFGDMQDVEFTIDDGALWLLQTRSGKRTVPASLRIAVDMANERLITRAQALLRINPASLDQLLHPMIAPDANRQIATKGLPASPGAATGKIVFTSKAAVDARKDNIATILVRPETSPDDIHGMAAADGILTSRGGMTSHAAVVARGMGKPCITSARGLHIDFEKHKAKIGTMTLREGDVITLDGSNGDVLLGEVPLVEREVSGDFATLMEWSDEVRRMKVRTNVETLRDANTALQFGAEGIGLCRTENMFIEGDGLSTMRAMIMASGERERRAVLERLLPMQRDRFVELFEVMAGKPVGIRLLDPPLREFLPSDEEQVNELAENLNISIDELKRRMEDLHEINPMLGNRGARLAICYPEIAEMQTRAIIEAALIAAEKTGAAVKPEIIVPLVAYYNELKYLRERLDAVAGDIMREKGAQIDYEIGCIIEIPRAAIRADLIAQAADFFSFGTNDLTQTTLGISRDDAAPFLSRYLEHGVIEQDPFINIDRDGVGEIMKMAAEKGRNTRRDLPMGITGEHGGDPLSIEFFEELGLDYVSCSPYRVPLARLAAAQAFVRLAQKAVSGEAEASPLVASVS